MEDLIKGSEMEKTLEELLSALGKVSGRELPRWRKHILRAPVEIAPAKEATVLTFDSQDLWFLLSKIKKTQREVKLESNGLTLVCYVQLFI